MKIDERRITMVTAKPVYNITKFGLKALSQSISAEGEGKVRSFTLSTGFVKTPLAPSQIAAQAEQRGISTLFDNK
jgi:3-hydroxybutyrate dehydrogenase